MKAMIVCICKFFMQMIYNVMKLLPVKNRIALISRQSNHINDDFLLIRTDIEKRHKDFEVIVLTKMIGTSLIGKFLYIFHLIKQMYYFATSKVVILDTYNICASVLIHKKSLQIIQIWHAVGAFKKFGLSIVGLEEGSKKGIASLMNMHKNYDYACVSSEVCIPFYSEAFHLNKDNLVVYPLPRLDLYKDEKYICQKTNQILQKYPSLKSNKKKILYAPTFRKKEGLLLEATKKLINQIDTDRYELIIKFHPLSDLKLEDKRIIIDNDFSTSSMLFVVDYVITDYSAITFEAAFNNKPLFFYAFDIKDYQLKRNFYLDYYEDMPGIVSENAKEIVESIENDVYNQDTIKRFSEKYIKKANKNYTNDIVDFIFDKLT